MNAADSDTIYALASGPGATGVAVYRLSGPRAAEAFAVLCRRAPPAPRRAVRVRLHDPAAGEVLDDGLALYFPAPHSFTGEDVVELHLHGGRANIAATLRCLGEVPGLRMAEPGEFSKRAFLAGKLDLTAAEGLADLVAAETEAQRRQARRQYDGELARLYESWRDRALRLRAHLEASIDFVEEDLPPALLAGQDAEIDRLIGEVAAHLADNRRGERLRDGLSVVILGAPNAGKSSLLNALVRREAAIVSSIAGTTRDIVEAHLDLGGWPVVLADTAGLRDTAEEIESEGIRRALARAAAADLKIVLFAADAPLDGQATDIIDENSILVTSKCDLAPSTPISGRPTVAVSTRTGAGISQLLQILEREVAARLHGAGDVAVSRLRYRKSLESFIRFMTDARSEHAAVELRAELIRQAVQALGRITGRVGVEDLLDVVFRDFCIGK